MLSLAGKNSPPFSKVLFINAELHSDVAEAPIGPRSVVATSPDKLEECKWELEADTENFITTIEVLSLCSIHINSQF